MRASSARWTSLVGATLLLTLGLAFTLTGAVRPDALALVQIVAGCSALAATRYPDDALRRSGITLRWVTASLPLLGALLVGLLPVPDLLAGILAPGRVDALPDAAWRTLAASPNRLVGELSVAGLVLGLGAVTTTWGSVRYQRGAVEVAATLLTGALAVTALLHAGLGAREVFRLVTPEQAPALFFAPLVNPSHMAATMILGLPVATTLARQQGAPVWARVLATASALAALAVIAWVPSRGAWLVTVAVLGTMLAVAARSRREAGTRKVPRAQPRAEGPLGWAPETSRRVASTASRALDFGNALPTPSRAVGVAVVALGALIVGYAWRSGSITVRTNLWADTLRLAADHWFAGVGAGSFGAMLGAYRTDTTFIVFAHAHDDVLEYLAETGLVGLVALGAAIAILPFRVVRTKRRGRGLIAGLVGLGLYALGDFPLQIPAIALAATALLAALVSVYGALRPADPRHVRAALVVVALAQFAGAAWHARAALVADAVADLRALDALRQDATQIDGTRALEGRIAEDLQRLDLLLAHPPERALHEARHATDPASALRALVRTHADDPDLLRRAAVALAQTGAPSAADLDLADQTLARVTERDRADYRAWVARARLAVARGEPERALGFWVEAFRRDAPSLRDAYDALPIGVLWIDALEGAPPRYQWALASILQVEGSPTEALLAAERAAARDPAAYGDHLFRASIYVAMDEPAAALAWLEGVASRHPDDPAYDSRRGDLLERLGRHAEAATAFERGSRKDPRLRARALRAHARASDPRKALARARELELDGRRDSETDLEIATLQREAGNPAGCLDEIARRDLLSSNVAKRADVLARNCTRDQR